MKKAKARGSVYPRGAVLWMKYRGADGAWVAASTDLRVGEEKAARALLKAVNTKVEAQVDHGSRDKGPLTVERFVRQWIEVRKRRGVGSARDDETRLTLHALPALGAMLLDEVRPRHIRNLVRAMSAKAGTASGQLAPRTVRHVYATLRTMFGDALADEVIDTNPSVLKRGELPKKIDKDPTWRAGAIYTREEVEALISDERIPLDRRVVDAILVIAGLRFGELAALKWSRYDATTAPLGKLVVAESYDFKEKRVKGVKSGVPREVPVHATLAKVLTAWKLGGWAAMMGRPPKQDDLVLPPRPEWTDEPYRNANRALRRFCEDLERLSLRRRRIHDLRRTFVTLARADGARKDSDSSLFRYNATNVPRPQLLGSYTNVAYENFILVR